MSTPETCLCRKCKVELYFDKNIRSKSGKLIPLEEATKLPHNCTIIGPFPCNWCKERIYLDKNVVSKYGKLIPLSYEIEEPHYCPKRPKEPKRELHFFRDRGAFED